MGDGSFVSNLFAKEVLSNSSLTVDNPLNVVIISFGLFKYVSNHSNSPII